MPFPYRSLKSIQPLPSIYTAFPVNHSDAQTSIDSAVNSGTCLIRHIEDGIEVVPFERRNSVSAPILSPDQNEKEVLFISQTETGAVEKPLPSLPGNSWQRLSIRQRMLALLFAQLVMLMVVGLALMAVKQRSSQRDAHPRARTVGNDSAHTEAVLSIQRGMFAVAVQLPEQQSSACLANMNESAAWRCASDMTLQLNILPSPADDDHMTLITLGFLLGNDSLARGHQTPDLQPTQLTRLANNSSAGQTYHFRSTYDKIIYIPESSLAPKDEPSKETASSHAAFQPGETLWQCTFNDTLMEGYIYVDQPSTTKVIHTGPGSNASVVTGTKAFPYAIKLVEQTIPSTTDPYCERLVVQDDGSVVTGSEKVTLRLREPAMQGRSGSSLVEPVKFRPRSPMQSTDSCRCQWLIKPLVHL
ncbi:hypothetical protein T440DRAFT_456546 [Plenodomus tracheiphilus IPT5]|uniref:DUF7820 domain-containing protein n=1 Tax=Plenodomus tracheiphilus IPT5 TaxID=1408161 RepID=A0A6A7AWE5_9PLEO|nr:hypothetical protein T440DRAFT_456546 [Plenodomus tracheiphilus IPT5]